MQVSVHMELFIIYFGIFGALMLQLAGKCCMHAIGSLVN